jgi:hypothetical protein
VSHREIHTLYERRVNGFHPKLFKRANMALADPKTTLVVGNGDEITSSTMHHSFRPPLPDLKSQKHQNSLEI